MKDLQGKIRSRVWTNEDVRKLREQQKASGQDGISVVGSEDAGPVSAGGSNRGVCADRPNLAREIETTLAAWEHAIASDKLDEPATKFLDQADKAVAEWTSSNNGYCAYKTVLTYLERRGAGGLYEHIRDSGDAVWLEADNGNTLRAAAYIEEYTKSELHTYIYHLADARDGGSDRLKRACERLDRMPKPAGFEVPSYCRQIP